MFFRGQAVASRGYLSRACWRAMRAASFVAVLSTACAACDRPTSKSPPENGDAGVVAALENFEQLVALAQCESVLNCYSPFDRSSPTDVAIALAGACPGDRKDLSLRAALDTGHVQVDAELASRCFDDIRNCMGDSAACSLALVGTLQEGEPCRYSQECASRRCTGAADWCGVCEAVVPLAGLGERCLTSADCAAQGQADVRCREETLGMPKCMIVKQVAEGDECFVKETCKPGTYCRGGRCANVHRFGERCESNESCEVGTVCSESVSGTRMCKPVLLRDAGDSCTSAFVRAPLEAATLDVCDPIQGLACDSERLVCVKAVSGGVGDSCAGDVLRCSAGLICGPGERCFAPAANGEPCEAACVSGYCGDDGAGNDVCVSRERALSCPAR